MTRMALAMLGEALSLLARGFCVRLGSVLGVIVGLVLIYEARRPADGWTDVELMGVTASLDLIAMIGLTTTWNMGRQVRDGGGYPFLWAFVRPAPTWLLVAVPMLARALVAWLVYFLPVALVDLLYGNPPYVMAGSLYAIPIVLLFLASSWWTREGGLPRVLGVLVAVGGTGLILYYGLHHHTEAARGDVDTFFRSWSLGPRDALALVGTSFAAIVWTTFGVQAQRRGESGSRLGVDSREERPALDWFLDLYAVDCPTTAPRRAEFWAEVMGRGMPTLTWGLIAAACLPTAWLLSAALDSVILWWLSTMALVLPPIAVAAPGFGVRLRAGAPEVSVFEATRAVDVGWLCFMRIGTALASLLLALGALLLTAWLAAPLTDPLQDQGAGMLVDLGFAYLADWLTLTPLLEQSLTVVIRLVELGAVLALLASLQAMYLFLADRLTMALFALLSYAMIVGVLVGSEALPFGFGLANLWLVALVVFASVPLLVRAVWVNRVLSPRQLGLLIGLWVFYAACRVLERQLVGGLAPDTPLALQAALAAWVLSPLGILLLAPWSMWMVRHR